MAGKNVLLDSKREQLVRVNTIRELTLLTDGIQHQDL